MKMLHRFTSAALVMLALTTAVPVFAVTTEGAGAAVGGAAGTAAGTAEGTAAGFTPIVPELGVPIPGLTFTPAHREGDSIIIPYLGQYINAGYRYLVGVILIVAIIMVVWGGFRYLLGSSLGSVNRGKEIIRDAIAGMLIVISAYVILHTVNPAAIDIRALSLSSVQRQDIDLELLTTNGQTGMSDSDQRELEAAAAAEATSPSPASPSTMNRWEVVFRSAVRSLQTFLISPAEASTVGTSVLLAQAAATGAVHVDPLAVDCPVTLETPYDETSPSARPGDVVQRSRRTLEFIQKITPVITGGTLGQRIVRIGDAAAKCHVTMGSCNATVQTINQIAGLHGLGTVVGSGPHQRGREANSDQVAFMTRKVSECRSDRRCQVRAFREVYEKLRREIPDYPGSWINDLQPGDALYVFNGNGAVGGQHSLIFVGWADHGKANVVQGGRYSDGLWVREHPQVCIKPECLLPVARGGGGGLIYPVTKVFRPQ